MRVTFLGTGTGIPAAGHSPAGLYVQAGGERLILDAGAGTLQRLQRLGVTFHGPDRLFFTHFHPDHCLDLVSFLFAMRIPYMGRTRPFTIYGPRGLRQLYRRLNTAFRGWISPRGYRLTLKEVGRQTRIQLPHAVVRTQPMQHYQTGAVGYRIEAGGRSIAYSGDTDYCRGIVRLGAGANTLILECSLPDARKVTGHLSPAVCGRIAKEAGCQHLVLTHFYPVFRGVDIRRQVRRFYRGRLTLAKDFTSLRV